MSRRRVEWVDTIVQAVVALSALVVGAVLVGRVITGVSGDVVLDVAVALVLLASAVVAGRSWWSSRRLSAEIRRGTATVLRRVDETRAKQSRHEYRHETALARIEQTLNAVRADVEGQVWAQHGGQARELRFTGEGATRVLFVTSNGGGLGHLTRCLAVAQRNQDRLSAAVVTLSTAHDAVRELGFDVEYVPSQATTGVPWPQWHRRFARHMHALLTLNEVDVVVFDGTWVYRGLTEACERLAVPLVWLCRGTWRAEADTSQLEDPLRHCDHLMVPDDVSGMLPPVEMAARTVSPCPPITIADRETALPAEGAKRGLGLDPTGRYALVQVGGGNSADVSDVAGAAVAAIRRQEGVVPVVVASPLSSHAGVPDDDAVVISGVYPLARYLDAFEFAVCGAGYNAVHENLAARLPAVYVPSARTVTDDQEARARALAAQGLGLVAASADELEGCVRQVADARGRDVMRERLQMFEMLDGARAAGDTLVAVAGGSGTDGGREALRA